MKKFSISLFALLAIVLAVSSAFTVNNSSKKVFNTFEAWGITPNAVSFPASYTNAASNIDATMYSDANAFPTGSTDAEKLDNIEDAYKLAHSLLQLCTAQSGKTCTVYVQTSTQTVLAVKEGTFDPQ